MQAHALLDSEAPLDPKRNDAGCGAPLGGMGSHPCTTPPPMAKPGSAAAASALGMAILCKGPTVEVPVPPHPGLGQVLALFFCPDLALPKSLAGMGCVAVGVECPRGWEKPAGCMAPPLPNDERTTAERNLPAGVLLGDGRPRSGCAVSRGVDERQARHAADQRAEARWDRWVAWRARTAQPGAMCRPAKCWRCSPRGAGRPSSDLGEHLARF